MTTQTELFPRTTLELLDELYGVHRADQDKAVKALDALSDDEKIAKAYQKAEDRVAKAIDLCAAIDQAAERERKRLTTTGSVRSVAQGAVDAFNNGARARDTDGYTATASVVPASSQSAFIDEVAAELDKHGVEYERDKLLPAVDSITGEVAPAVVFALYPGDDEPHATPVGDRTRYGELVADYFTAAGLTGLHEAKDWTVIAETGLAATDGQRNLRDVIVRADYGRHLLVRAGDQGSVTGAPVEMGAS